MSKRPKQPNGDLPDGTEPAKPSVRERVDPYLKYSGMAFQMGFTILLGVLLGKKIDQHLGWDPPYATMILSILATVAALYLALKDFINPPETPRKPNPPKR